MPSFTLIHPTVWPQYTNVTDRQDRQTGQTTSDSIGRVPFYDLRKEGCYASFGGAAWSPSNTMWPRPRSTSVPSGILIHPAVLATTDRPKIGGFVPLGGAGSQSNMIHPAVWPQYMGRKVGGAAVPLSLLWGVAWVPI